MPRKIDTLGVMPYRGRMEDQKREAMINACESTSSLNTTAILDRAEVIRRWIYGEREIEVEELEPIDDSD